MSFSTVMVHLELGRSNANLLKIAGDLAERCQSKVVGIAASQPLFTSYVDAAYVSGEIFEQERAAFERESQAAQAEFRTTLGGHSDRLEWRCAQGVASLAEYVAREARSADVILTTPHRRDSTDSGPRHMKIGDLVLRAGRPVLLVPEAKTSLQLDRVMLAWKDGREARRAAADALPILELASQVTVVEVAAEQDRAAAQSRLADVVAWLAGHGIPAESRVETPSGSDASAVGKIAHALRADLIIAGAYGHSRLREWTLGGVTMDLLIDPVRCVLLSH